MNLAGLAAVSLTAFGLLGADEFGLHLPNWVLESFKQSPALLFGLLVFWWAFRYVREQHKEHLKSKDAEIERLVKERDKLQNLVLKSRLSTDDPSPPSDPKAQPGSKPKKKP